MDHPQYNAFEDCEPTQVLYVNMRVSMIGNPSNATRSDSTKRQVDRQSGDSTIGGGPHMFEVDEILEYYIRLWRLTLLR